MIAPRFNFDAQVFLREYWQKKPLLIKSAIPDFSTPISPEELAGLALEPEADSRIVSFDGLNWALETGPFDESDFLREGQWSLLVQGVDTWFPEVTALRGCIDFLPSWRFDDIMVSYATDGAGVGPHYDQYDVFLLQGMGQRQWKVGPRHLDTRSNDESSELQLIEEFEPDNTYVLSPGDALYLPPGFAHWGEAVGESMTYSLGFRAPRISDLVARLADDVIENIDSSLLLEDRDSLRIQPRAGEITDEHIRNAREAVLNATKALTDADNWYPEFLTEGNLSSASQQGALPAIIQLAPQHRLIWQDRGDSITAYAGGERYELRPEDESLLSELCSGANISFDSLTPDQVAFLEKCWGLGIVEAPQVSDIH